MARTSSWDSPEETDVQDAPHVQAAIKAAAAKFKEGQGWRVAVRAAVAAADDAEWQPIETAPKGRDASGRMQYVQLIGRYSEGGPWTDVVGTAWWFQGHSTSPQGWERWEHSFPPSHWRRCPSPPVNCIFTEATP